MMLWYKAWRESRSRFLLAAVVVTVYSIGALLNARTSFPPPQAPHLPYSAFVWGDFYAPFKAVAFGLIALVFGLGGLQRERASHTATFTLALPVTRGQLVGVRFLTGLLELTTIAFIPAVVVPALSPVVVKQTYPWSQGVEYAALFMSWGVVWFATGFAWSTLCAGEFTAAAASLLSPWAYLIVYAGILNGERRFPEANPFATMSGGLDRGLGGRMLLTEPLPWPVMLVLAVVTTALFFGAWRATVRQNF